jgi:VanZ family protein
METRNLYLTLLVMESVFIVWASLQPASTLPGIVEMVPRADYIGHFIAYLIYAFLAERTMLHFRKGGAREAFLLAAAFGALMEILQLFADGRFPDVVDWIMDCAGALVGVYSYRLLKRFR